MRSERKPENYGIVDANVIADPELSVQAKLVYTLLCCYADKTGECFPTRETMADQLKVSTRWIDRATRELEDEKIIHRWQKPKRVTIYNVLDTLIKHWKTKPKVI